jgi:hypothetical protein
MGSGRPFQPGNKLGKGRRSGSRNRRTILLAALEGDSVKIIESIARRALKSDPTAMRLCMERLLPVSRTRFRLGPVQTPAHLTNATSDLIHAVAEGDLSAREGESVVRIVESQRRNLELQAFDERLKALEEKAAKGKLL